MHADEFTSHIKTLTSFRYLRYYLKLAFSVPSFNAKTIDSNNFDGFVHKSLGFPELF